MSYRNDFIIPFSGLKEGKHTFSLKIEDEFFEHFDFSEIRKCRLHVDCTLEKQSRMMIFLFDISGVVCVPCDRCAADFDLPVKGQQKLIVKFGNEYEEESDDILVINEKEHELDISQFLYEYVHLLLPLQKIHDTDENGNSLCDPEVTRYINEAEEHPVDPRWEVLKNLKKDINN